jgi:hypothetical protein
VLHSITIQEDLFQEAEKDLAEVKVEGDLGEEVEDQ